MALYLVAFNDEWVPDLTLEELRESATSARALIEEMTDADVFVFSDGGSAAIRGAAFPAAPGLLAAPVTPRAYAWGVRHPRPGSWR